MPPVSGRAPGEVTRKIAEKFLEAEIKALPPVKEDPGVDRKSYPDFAGRYDYHGSVLTVTAEGDHLYSQLTGQPRFEIFPSAPDEFFWKVTDAQVVFLRDEKRAVIAARHTQNGNIFKATRLTEPEVKLSAAELDAILGQVPIRPRRRPHSHPRRRQRLCPADWPAEIPHLREIRTRMGMADRPRERKILEGLRRPHHHCHSYSKRHHLPAPKIK
jgi:hypothetical protein